MRRESGIRERVGKATRAAALCADLRALATVAPATRTTRAWTEQLLPKLRLDLPLMANSKMLHTSVYRKVIQTKIKHTAKKLIFL